jgi:hypothetical protein
MRICWRFSIAETGAVVSAEILLTTARQANRFFTSQPRSDYLKTPCFKGFPALHQNFIFTSQLNNILPIPPSSLV